MDTSTNREFYAFRNTDTGELVRVREQGHEYRLSSYGSDPVFEAESPEQLAQVLFENTPGYNTSRDCPGWGMYRREQLAPVKVAVRIDVESFELPAQRRVPTIAIRSIPYMVARRYAGGPLEGVMPDALVTFWLVELPDGMTLEEVKAWEGLSVFPDNNKHICRTLYKAVEVPEEFGPDVVGKRAALFLASVQ